MEEEVAQKPVLKKEPLRQKYADLFLGVISFAESAFLPILTDPFLLAMTLAKPKAWLRYTLIAGTTSVLGGMFGYFLGAFFFNLFGSQLIAFYGIGDLFDKAVISMNAGAFVFTLIGAFTPVPYKLVAIVGGVLHINILTFILASIVGRFGRFILVTYISYKFGEHALPKFGKHFNVATLAVVGGVALYAIMMIAK